MKPFYFCFFIFLMCLPGIAQENKKEVPEFSSGQYVLDKTNTLRPLEKRALEKQLRTLESFTGSEMAVLMVSSTGKETIQQYGTRVAHSLGIGQEEENNGILITLAKKDRKVRIDVGYGLEEVVTDAFAHKVINEKMKPHLSEGAYFDGLNAGIEALINRVQEAQPVQEQQGNYAGPNPHSPKIIEKHGISGVLVLVLFLPVLVGFEYIRFKYGMVLGRLIGLAIVVGSLFFLQSLFFALVYGGVLLIISVLLQLMPKSSIKGLYGGRTTAWVVGGSMVTGSDGLGGGSGGGGFGGGDFGGGGADGGF